MTETIEIDPRFNGYPDTAGNGGYVAGRFAAFLPGITTVTLRRPVPLGTSLALERRGETLLVHDGDELVAEVEPASVEVSVIDPVPLELASKATARYVWRDKHPAATCFVCGTGREDGLRLFPGKVEGREAVATTWTPTADFDNGSGWVRHEILWAALDCPSGFGFFDVDTFAVLGQLTGDLRAPVPIGDELVVAGWSLGSERRKHFAGSAIFDGSGTVLAAARATWIMIG
ncbi:MAG: hotdog fold domain-containing protein [Acidimicrobiia bacterium]|nr:hotdog fold domain-containing protein [Acidimicrobiia bacterium]